MNTHNDVPSIIVWLIIIFFTCITIASCYCILKLFYPPICIGSYSELGAFIVAMVSAGYAFDQYQNYKNVERTKLLCEYNQRYSSDRNIHDVVSWMLRVAIVNDKGDIVGADPLRCFCKPGIHEKEMFMRFFEELYLHVDNKSIEKKKACLLFSYYAIKFDEIKEFRLEITDYNSKEYCVNYHKFVNEMKEEWIKIKNNK